MRSGEMLDQFADSLRAELDFRREADAMAEMALLLAGQSTVRVPKVYRELCTRRLLVQERFEGFTVADTEQLDDSGVDRRRSPSSCSAAMLDQVLRNGFFHADPHPGNIFVFADGTLGLIDFGAVGRLDPIQQAAVVDMLAALARRDVGLLRDGIERVADITEAAPRAARAGPRPAAWPITSGHRRGRPRRAAGPRATLREFGVRLPGDLVMLSRALVTLDGTLRVIAPGMSLVTAATEMMASRPTPRRSTRRR